MNPNDILLRKERKPFVNPLCNGGIKVPIPKWTYTAPTPLLSQKGLTDTILRQELQTINAKSEEHQGQIQNWMPYANIILLLAIIGMVLFAVGSSSSM